MAAINSAPADEVMVVTVFLFLFLSNSSIALYLFFTPSLLEGKINR
jgi:hypothetical protein